MFPYSDNLIRKKGYYGVPVLILAISTVTAPMLLNEEVSKWMLRHMSFIPILFSVNPWSNIHALATSMLLHGDIFHLLGNCLFLWVFGRSLEQLFGTLLFTAAFPFLSLTGLLLHWVLNSDSVAPVIGSSGAIATLMGAYLTLFPQARMKMIFTIGIFFKRFSIPAWGFLFYWGGLQLLSLIFGAGSEDNVAYAVHVGGFILGVMAAMIWKVSYPFAEEKLAGFTETSFKH